MPGKSPSWPLDLQPGTLPLLHSLSSVTWTCFKVWESYLLIKDLALQRSIIIYVDTRLSLGSCSCSDLPTVAPFSFGYGCMFFLRTHLQHRLQETVPDYPGWSECPSSGPVTPGPSCAVALRFSSYFLGTLSLHWCWVKPASWIQLASSPYAASCPCLYSP